MHDRIVQNPDLDRPSSIEPNAPRVIVQLGDTHEAPHHSLAQIKDPLAFYSGRDDAIYQIDA